MHVHTHACPHAQAHTTNHAFPLYATPGALPSLLPLASQTSPINILWRQVSLITS